MKNQVIVLKEGEVLNKDFFRKPSGVSFTGKPEKGGLWTSTKIESSELNSSWLEWASKEGLYSKNEKLNCIELKVLDGVKVLEIDNKEDYKKALKYYSVKSKDLFGKEVLRLSVSDVLNDYDAFHLTENGLAENSSAFKYWDCESVVWGNLNFLREV